MRRIYRFPAQAPGIVPALISQPVLSEGISNGEGARTGPGGSARFHPQLRSSWLTVAGSDTVLPAL